MNDDGAVVGERVATRRQLQRVSGRNRENAPVRNRGIGGQCPNVAVGRQLDCIYLTQRNGQQRNRDAVAGGARQRGAAGRGVGHAVAGGDPNVGADGYAVERGRVQARLRGNLSDDGSIYVHGVGRDRAAAVKRVQPRNRDGEHARPRCNLVDNGNDGRVGRGRCDARFGVAVVQIQMHARRELEPAQILRLVRNDALRLLLVVRPSGLHDFPVNRRGHVHGRINAHVFKIVARVARASHVKDAAIRIHHKVGIVETSGREWVAGRRGGIHQLVRIRVRVVVHHRGKAQHRHGNVGVRVVGHRKVAVIQVPGAGLEGGYQVAGWRRCQQVLAFGHVQQVGVAGCARDRGGRGLHGSHVLGAVRFHECAAVLR